MGKELTEAAKIARREYMRKWNADHPEKQKEYQKRFWERKVTEQRKEEDHGTDKGNPDRIQRL